MAGRPLDPADEPGCLAFARNVWGKFHQRWALPAEDLLSAAYLGLLHARRAWRPGAGVDFKLYAYRRILGQMAEEARDRDHLPRTHRRRVGAANETLPPALQAPVSLADLPPPEEPAQDSFEAQVIERLTLRAAMSRLRPKERHILSRRFFDEADVKVIAAELSTSSWRVYQIQQAALKKLRRILTEEDP